MWKLKQKYEGQVLHCIDKMSDQQIEMMERDGMDFLNKYFEKL